MDDEWGYISLMGLSIDYFKFRLLPFSRRTRILNIAKMVEKNKAKMAEAIGPLSLLL